MLFAIANLLKWKFIKTLTGKHALCAKVIKIEVMKMTEMIENHMVEDWYWDEIEYGVPNHRRLKEQQRNYEMEEYEEDEE